MNVLTINRSFVKVPASVYFDNLLINEVTQYKYLGLIIDNRLTWKPHADSVLVKLAGITRMLRGVVREKWGVRMNIMRLIYKTIFCPIMLYGIAIWGWRMTGKTMCMWFNKVIRNFCIMSTRCFRSTSNEVLFQLMETTCFSDLVKQEVVRVAMLQLNLARNEKDYVFRRESATNRLAPISIDHFFFICKQEISSECMNVMYENLLQYYDVSPTQWEITNTCVKERMLAMWEGSNIAGWVIYIDASVSSYGAGWAFAVYHHGFCVNISNASLSKCSIFTAESQAIRYAAQYVSETIRVGTKEVVEIRSDAQSVIRALEKTIIVDPMLREVKDALGLASKNGTKVLLKWVPSHTGIEGNEMADIKAKIAVDLRNTCRSAWVKRDLRSCIQKTIFVRSEQKWEMFQSRIPKLFFPKASCFASFLHSSPSIELCQLVSGHCRLNDFLCNKLAVISSPIYRCNTSDETIAHFLFVCPMYEHVRNNVWDEFQPTYEFLRKDWRKLDEYIRQTKRFACQ